MAAQDPSTHISVQGRLIKRRGPERRRPVSEPRALQPLGSPAWILLLWGGLAACCTGAMALQLPSITILRMLAELPRPGDSVTVSCEALSELPELTLLYWLENGFFVKSLHPDGAVREGTVQEELQGSGMALHRDLHFSSFDNQHLHTNFTCMVLSPFGVDTREVRWLSQALAPVTGKSGGLG